MKLRSQYTNITANFLKKQLKRRLKKLQNSHNNNQIKKMERKDNENTEEMINFT